MTYGVRPLVAMPTSTSWLQRSMLAEVFGGQLGRVLGAFDGLEHGPRAAGDEADDLRRVGS